eukprot:CAMPEP_0169482422 /NCGR_PEP_ID=MMETSP1042-20121227/30677_1 /TAXON_ID=464988 /ORGANISM="Hemiselmis andersenii, Strain CCMP1180" /LENGTH=76 /DNA_ID=CAMNT_0009597309 /DNA_START=47 /DNA_END=274 /DNA_ORIENTATION=-
MSRNFLFDISLKCSSPASSRRPGPAPASQPAGLTGLASGSAAKAGAAISVMGSPSNVMRPSLSFDISGRVPDTGRA